MSDQTQAPPKPEELLNESVRCIEAAQRLFSEDIEALRRFALALRTIRRGCDHPEGRPNHPDFYEAIEWASKVADEALQGPPEYSRRSETHDPARIVYDVEADEWNWPNAPEGWMVDPKSEWRIEYPTEGGDE